MALLRRAKSGLFAKQTADLTVDILAAGETPAETVRNL